MHTTRSFSAFALGALLLAGCAGTPDDYNPVADTRWELDQVYQRQTVLHNDRGMPYLELDSSAQRMQAFTGCNRVGGSYTGRGATLRFDSIASTRMYCANAMAQEKAFMRALERTASARVNDGTLLLLDASDRVLARFNARADE